MSTHEQVRVKFRGGRVPVEGTKFNKDGGDRQFAENEVIIHRIDGKLLMIRRRGFDAVFMSPEEIISVTDLPAQT